MCACVGFGILLNPEGETLGDEVSVLIQGPCLSFSGCKKILQKSHVQARMGV